MSGELPNNALVSAYRNRFGEPADTNEVYGYWLFLAGGIVGVVGILLFVLAALSGGGPPARKPGYALAAIGLAAALTGGVYRLPSYRAGDALAFLGFLGTLAAVIGFYTVFPRGWSVGSGAAIGVVLLYTAGIAVIVLGGVVAPVLFGVSRDATIRGREADELREELEETRQRLAEVEETRDQLESDLDRAQDRADKFAERAEAAEAEADEFAERASAAEAMVASYEDSNGTFEVYKDAAGEWRWRLVHQNRNIIATSGEGYRSDRSARRGMRSVRRNALGAAVVWLPVEDEAEHEEPEPEPEPVHEESHATFELYEDKAGEPRWRLRHDNGNVISAAVRGFSSKSNAQNGIERVQRYVPTADYLEFDPAGFEVYEDAAGEWRWRLVHRNGNILADPGQGYASRSGARDAVDRIVEHAPDAPVDPEDSDGYRFETYEDEAGEHRWRLVAANDNVVADSSEGYTEASERDRAVERIKTYAPEADTLEVFDAAFELFADEAGEHRWRLRHRNGTILAGSGEGYGSRAAAVEAINSVKRNAPNADVEEEDAD